MGDIQGTSCLWSHVTLHLSTEDLLISACLFVHYFNSAQSPESYFKFFFFIS